MVYCCLLVSLLQTSRLLAVIVSCVNQRCFRRQQKKKIANSLVFPVMCGGACLVKVLVEWLKIISDLCNINRLHVKNYFVKWAKFHSVDKIRNPARYVFRMVSTRIHTLWCL